MEEVYDKLTELKDSNKKLENDNKEHESEIINNKKNIENANQEIEEIMKELIEQGGFKENEMAEIQIIKNLINNSDKKEHKSNMIKCLDLLILFSNQYLENYKLSIQEANKEESKEDQLNELLLLSKEELVGMCKDNDLPHTGSKKKLAEKIMTLYE